MPVASDAGVGALLSGARIAQNLSIEELAWRLRIRPETLRALESEAFEGLGHHGHVRTHIRSYARILGLDTAEAMRVYRQRHEDVDQSPLTALDEKDRIARKHGHRTRWLRAAVVAGVLLIAGSVFGVLKGPGGQTVPSAFPSARVQQAARAVSPLTPPQQTVAVRIAAGRGTTVSVIADGKTVFTGVLSPGASRLFTAVRLIELVVADGSAVSVWANESPVKTTPGEFRGSYGPGGVLGGRRPL